MREVRAPTSPHRIAGQLGSVVDEALRRAVDERWAERIWERDVTLWSDDPAVGPLIAQRLGWLDAPAGFGERVEELEAFAAGARSEGFEQAIVCGMGGSSLAPEVLARSLPLAEQGIPVHVLDSTDPAAVATVRDRYDPARTLYLIATKSGTTTETLSFLAFFWQVVEEAHGGIPRSLPGEHFVAISDPGKSLEAIPHQEAFRSAFLNPPDVGGRYSALTYVGLVPGALQGIDLRALLEGGAAMAERCRRPGADNPGVELGVTLGALAREGRDKLTLLIDPAIASFGAWTEQLIAESTGKLGVGIVPVDAEPPGEPDVYGQDRLFVRLAQQRADGASSEWLGQTDRSLDDLAAAGHPVVDLTVEEREGLGGEFFRWEFATAIAGAVLGINPFDEPNVTESKDNTRRVLGEFRSTGRLPAAEPLAQEGQLTLYGDSALRLTAGGSGLGSELSRHLARVRPSGYVAIQAYLAATPQRNTALVALRRLVRDRTRRATTLGYGPRFLHSTGQLHKGGPRTGCFMQLTADHPQDVPIPGEQETFGTLIDAQALGDFASLEGHELPIVRVHLGSDPDAGLAALTSVLERSL